MTDCTLVVNQDGFVIEIPVHRVILQTDYFSNLFSSNWKPVGDNKYQIGLTHDATLLKELVRFLYTGNVAEETLRNTERLILLYQLAFATDATALSGICRQNLIKQINDENVLTLSILGLDCQAKDNSLIESCLTYFRQHPEVLSSFEIPEDLPSDFLFSLLQLSWALCQQAAPDEAAFKKGAEDFIKMVCHCQVIGMWVN